MNPMQEIYNKKKRILDVLCICGCNKRLPRTARLIHVEKRQVDMRTHKKNMKRQKLSIPDVA